MLRFSRANGKLKKLEKLIKKRVDSIALQAGFSCPFAKACLSKVVEQDGKRVVVDGPDNEFRCYSASTEGLREHVYNLHKANSEYLRSLRTLPKMVLGIESALPVNADVIRIHTDGDFFNKTYFKAWLEVIKNHKDKYFYAYTKSLPYWIDERKRTSRMRNLALTASYGGRRDDLIKSERLRFTKVVEYVEDAKGLKLELDDNDFHAYDPDNKTRSFALLIHNTQPAGTSAAKALAANRKAGLYK